MLSNHWNLVSEERTFPKPLSDSINDEALKWNLNRK